MNGLAWTGNAERQREVEAAWRRFVLDGATPPAGLRGEVLASWCRSRDVYQLDPAARGPVARLSSEALLERIEQDELLHVAAPILRDFSDRLSLSDHVLACFDAEGWMLSIDGDPAMVDRLTEIGFCPATSWAEASAGTNGPGTALATLSPMEIFAGEHYVAAWQPFSCAAVPLFQPGVEAPVGVIDLTGPWTVRRRQALSMTKALGRAIEERIRAICAVRDEVVRYAFRAARDAGEVVVAVDRHGRVLAANDAAARRRFLHDGALPDVLRLAVKEALSAASASRAELSLDGWRTPVAVSAVRYEGAPVGAIIRVRRAAGPPHRARTARPVPSSTCFEVLYGSAPPFLEAVALAKRAAGNDLPVVLTGESGTGKELFARAIHGAGPRRDGPFVALNCGAIPAALLEAELFGYEGGTFTGASKEGRPGRFEDADGGTLLLDEVSELSAAAQTALLRVLEEREVVRLGTGKPRPVDVRVVAASNRRLAELVGAGRFREDLYYRLAVLVIDLPPLRARGADVVGLAEGLLAEAGSALALSPEARSALLAHPWPGNVRELRNVMLRASAMAEGPLIGAADLRLERLGAEPVGHAEQLREALHGSEREALRAVLARCGWSFSRAARELGVTRMTVYRRVKKFGLTRA